MPQDFDPVAEYGRACGWELRPRTVLVEGTTDVDVFRLAARLESEESGLDLLQDLAIIAAGEGDDGGTRGVCRELIRLQGFARTFLLPNGRPRYRFIGLFDNDKAGIEAVKGIKNFDGSIVEYRDVFRLHPVMPCEGNLDPKTLGKTFARMNGDYKGLEWELEDLLPPSFTEAFLEEFPDAVRNTIVAGDKVHRNFTGDGKARLHHFIKKQAMRRDLVHVVAVIRALRFYLTLPAI